MSKENAVTVVGNLTDDPELRYTPNGQAVADFRIAVNKRFKDESSGEWKEGETTFLKVVAWRQLAENVAESLTKGTRAVVVGELRINEWEAQDGSKRSTPEISADEIAPSLRWATASVERNSRGS